MALHLEIYGRCHSVSVGHAVVEMINPATQPDFEGDVAPEWLELFHAVADLNKPDIIELDTIWLHLCWYESDTSLSLVQRALLTAGVPTICAYEVPDGADASDAPADGHDPASGYFYLNIGEQLINITMEMIQGAEPRPKIPKLNYQNPEVTLGKLLSHYDTKPF